MSTHDLSVGGKPVSAANPLPTTGGGGGGSDTTTLGAAVPAVAVLTAYQDPNGNVSTAKVDASGNQLVVGVGVAQGSTSAGETLSPVGARSLAATPTDVDGKTNMPVMDLEGSTAVQPYGLPDNSVSGATAAMSATADVQLLAAAGAGLFNHITTIVISNAHATVGTEVVIKEGATVLMTIPAAAVFGGAVITLPKPLRQPTANTVVNVANLTTGSATKASAVGFKAK